MKHTKIGADDCRLPDTHAPLPWSGRYAGDHDSLGPIWEILDADGGMVADALTKNDAQLILCRVNKEAFK